MTELDIAKIAARAADDKKAHKVMLLDIQGLSVIADYFVICHGNSEPQVQAIVDNIKDSVEEAGATLKGREGYDDARWVLMDLGDVVVHVFHRDEREFYNIERLWKDARVVEFTE
ncbi:ribosome-associated protein [Aneurinibacillus soli]|uniref:Ribosomal silencing factor RsfS n=1 Tax=Aneurinibacillus soli TaxID=1500254 RepID=A0A0U5B883_9BACL|nr:ribosome silencing factor [Aneurinibacillus soli]PYE62586.1 ribosome-associated protein [Aneurinibacillus soli]BAU27148.1 ribosomal silencing factor RsfS [Aneurinibacillus soli]